MVGRREVDWQEKKKKMMIGDAAEEARAANGRQLCSFHSLLCHYFSLSTNLCGSFVIVCGAAPSTVDAAAAKSLKSARARALF